MKCNHKKVILVERQTVYWYSPEHSPEDTSYWDYIETIENYNGKRHCTRCGNDID